MFNVHLIDDFVLHWFRAYLIVITIIIQLGFLRMHSFVITLICIQLLFSQGCISSVDGFLTSYVYPVAVQPRIHN
jgi:hypothetical protein